MNSRHIRKCVRWAYRNIHSNPFSPSPNKHGRESSAANIKRMGLLAGTQPRSLLSPNLSSAPPRSPPNSPWIGVARTLPFSPRLPPMGPAMAAAAATNLASVPVPRRNLSSRSSSEPEEGSEPLTSLFTSSSALPEPNDEVHTSYSESDTSPRVPNEPTSSSVTQRVSGDEVRFGEHGASGEAPFENSDFLSTPGVELVTSVAHDGSFWVTPALYIIRGLHYAHEATGIPWWATITGYTVLMRLCLTPLTLLQAKSSAELALLYPKLPNVFSPQTRSWRTLFNNIQHFLKIKKELRGPSLWFIFSPPFFQLPVFVFSIFAIRYMALSNFPGFEDGGILWFKNLSALPQGNFGFIIPFSIAITYLINIQISFHGMKHRSFYVQTFFMFLKWILQFLTLPILLTTLNLPQGVHFYWLTNNIGNIILTTSLKSDRFRSIFNIPTFKEMMEIGKQRAIENNIREEMLQRKISSMGVHDLMNLAAQKRAEGKIDESIGLLKIVLEKDNNYPPVYNALGQLYFENASWVESSAYFSKFLGFQNADSDANITAYRSYGIALAQQSKTREAISILMELKNFSPSDDNLLSKTHFSQGLISLASLLQKEGKLEEAIYWLRKASKFENKIEALYVKPLEEKLKQKKK